MSRRRGRRRRPGVNWPLIAKIGGVILLFIGILGALFGTGYVTTDSQCKTAGFGGAASMDACRADEDYTYDRIAIVVGNTANSPVPTLSAELAKYLKNSLLADSGVSIDLISATPSRNTINYERSKIRDSGDNQTFLRDIDQMISNLDAALQTPPSENGAECIEAIQRAASIVQSKKGRSLIMVIGSGLADTAPLNFASMDLLSRTSNDLIKAYQDSRGSNNLPFYDVDLVWYGLGSTAAPQGRLTADAQDKLQSHYQAILTEMGIRPLFDHSILDGASLETKYTVKPTPVKTSTLKFEGRFDDASALGFNADTTIFRNGEAEAWAALQKSGIIDQINSNTAVEVRVDGYVAVECGAAANLELAQGRAEVVKKLLISHGIKNPVAATGVGQTDESKRNNICIGNNNISEAQLQQQRVVIISGKE